MRARFLLAAVAASTALSVGSPVLAADTWTTPFPGIRRLYRTTSAPLRIHALVVDLCTPGVSLRATASDERARTTSSFGNLVGAEAAVNGDYFSAGANYKTSGLAMGDGAAWSDTADNSSEGFVAFGPSVALLSPPAQVLEAPAGALEIVSGRPLVVKDGAVPASFDCSTHYCQNHPRTGAGLSLDRRTLVLVVVDGRTTSSVGVTMAGLGNILADLGADDAIAFDGGGSSTMWLAGDGVVNTPSDGAQRTVANHLGVMSKGIAAGVAASCVENAVEELTAGIHQLDELGTTDVDGDGRADVCARGAAGFRCHPSDGTAFGPAWEIPELSDEAGFVDAANYATIRMGDVNGDGRADVCARADQGVRCWLSTGAGFGRAIAGPAWSDEAGWQALARATTMRLVDIDGDGLDDLCARDAEGLVCARSTGAAFSASELLLTELADEAGWDTPARFGTLRFGDLDGDWRADVCARAADGMRCWLSTGEGFASAIAGPAWSDDDGWNELRYWSTIRLVDIDGDSRAELCARAADGMRCHRFEGDAFGPALTGPPLDDDSGWHDQQNYLTLRAADVDGDARTDLCARANAGWRCWLSTGDGFGDALTGPELSDDKGWFRHRYFRTIRTADIDGDGLRDLCARAAAGLRCWPSRGDAFGEAIAGPEWSDEEGWNLPQYYNTIHIAGPRPPRPQDGATAGAGGAAAAEPDAAEALHGGCTCRAARPGHAHALALALACALLIGARAGSRGRGAARARPPSWDRSAPGRTGSSSR